MAYKKVEGKKRKELERNKNELKKIKGKNVER